MCHTLVKRRKDRAEVEFERVVKKRRGGGENAEQGGFEWETERNCTGKMDDTQESIKTNTMFMRRRGLLF